MPSHLHVFRRFLRQMRSLSRVKFTLSLLPWSDRGRALPAPWETRRALEWQRVDALLESLRRLEA